MSIVKFTNSKGITYVYESKSYWDKEKKQPRNKRKLIGKLDEQGNIVPTGKSGRKKETVDIDDSSNELFHEELKELRNKLKQEELKVFNLESENHRLQKEIDLLLNDLNKLIDKYSLTCKEDK